MGAPLSTKDKQGIALMAGAVTIMIILGIAQFVVGGQRGRYDTETLCPTDRPYPHTIVLVDKTDPLSPTQQAYLRARLLQLRDQMKPLEKLSILVLEDERGAGLPVFAMCNPGSGREANELYQNPRKMQMQYDARFGAPLNRMLDDLLVGQTRPRSPIMEAVRDVAALPDFRDPSVARRLVIFSDMVQNVPEFSQYSRLVPFETFRGTSYGDWMMRTSLAGVDISIIYLLRPQYKATQTRGHALFWEEYFTALDARLNELDPIQ